MKAIWLTLVPLAALAGLLSACSHLRGSEATLAEQQGVALSAVQATKRNCAPDPHLTLFSVGVEARGGKLTVTGDVCCVEAKADLMAALAQSGVRVNDRVQVAPAAELGDQTWAIACLSVSSGREEPAHKAEMGTQLLMGEVGRVWKRATQGWLDWYLVQSSDGYLAWQEMGTFVRCTKAQAETWQNGPLLTVTALEDRILEQPEAGAQTVSDVVVCDRVKKLGEAGAWFKVELPDGRVGYLPQASAEDYRVWKAACRATPESIERTARRLLGRPYLWGANSPKGLDCSGFTKLVFALNGIELKRNASHQARQGMEVLLDRDLSQLRKGDLLFFGARGGASKPERITHVGLYLGDKLFIHSSERVHLSSLDPSSPIRDEHRIRTLLRARRFL